MFALAVVICPTPDLVVIRLLTNVRSFGRFSNIVFFYILSLATELQQLPFRLKASCSFSNFSAEHFGRGFYDSLAGHRTFLAQRLISLIKCARRSLTTRLLCGVRTFVWHVGNELP